MSQEEKRRLFKLCQSILRENGFDLKNYQDYDWIRSMVGQGYAHYYLAVCKDNSKMNEVDASIYRQLIDIDSKLGTNASLQLWSCLYTTSRSDLIKVCSTIINKALNFFCYGFTYGNVTDPRIYYRNYR